MKVKKNHLTGQIADFPLHVVQAMVDEQVRQGRPADLKVFASNLWNGFIWCRSKQGHDFWYDVIRKRQFHLIPNPEATEAVEKESNMKNFKVKKKHLTGEIADFPLHVVQLMVDEQVRQGNPADPSVFATRPTTTVDEGGFNWDKSNLGPHIWDDVIAYKRFDLIPKPEKPKGHVHAKLMKKYAKDAATHEKPWELWECKYDCTSTWHPLKAQPIWYPETQYRRKSNNQVESKEQPTPNEIIQAMLDKGMVVWGGGSDVSYEDARDRSCRCIQRVTGYDDGMDYPVRTGATGWMYAVPIDLKTTTEITELPK